MTHETLSTRSEIFDQSERFQNISNQYNEAAEIGSLILDISQITIDFADIERAPRYYEHKAENNAEHSFMLGLAAMEIGTRYYPGLSTGLMAQFALVHDLVELETGDVHTFQATTEDLQTKERAEHKALEKLAQTLPTHIADMLVCYEEQKLPEARLVRHIDKLLPYAVDINGAGLYVMKKEYGVTTAQEVLEQTDTLEERFTTMFPEQGHNILHKAHKILGNRFALEFNEV